MGWRCGAAPFRAQPSAPRRTHTSWGSRPAQATPRLRVRTGEGASNREPGAVFSKASCKGQRAPKKDEFQGDLGSRPGTAVPRMRLTDVLAETPGRSPASRPRAAAEDATTRGQQDCALRSFLRKHRSEQPGPGNGPSRALVRVGCRRAPGWACVSGRLRTRPRPPLQPPPPPLPASTEPFPLHSFLLWCLGRYCPKCSSPVSAGQTPTYPQPLCEAPPPLCPSPHGMGGGPSSGLSQTLT